MGVYHGPRLSPRSRTSLCSLVDVGLTFFGRVWVWGLESNLCAGLGLRVFLGGFGVWGLGGLPLGTRGSPVFRLQCSTVLGCVVCCFFIAAKPS